MIVDPSFMDITSIDAQWGAKFMNCSRGKMMREGVDDLFNICSQEQELEGMEI